MSIKYGPQNIWCGTDNDHHFRKKKQMLSPPMSPRPHIMENEEYGLKWCVCKNSLQHLFTELRIPELPPLQLQPESACFSQSFEVPDPSPSRHYKVQRCFSNLLRIQSYSMLSASKTASTWQCSAPPSSSVKIREVTLRALTSFLLNSSTCLIGKK